MIAMQESAGSVSDVTMTADDRIKLEPGWKEALRAEFDQPYMAELRNFLQQERLL